MGSNRSLAVLTTLVAAIATAALLAVNDPSIFTGDGTPGMAAFEVAIYFSAVVLAMVFAPKCC